MSDGIPMHTDLVVVILTLDEQLDPAMTRASVGQRAPVVVFDGRDVAPSSRVVGIEVHAHPCSDPTQLRNLALTRLRDRCDWVFFLHPGEAMTPALWKGLEACLRRSDLDGAFLDDGLVSRVLRRSRLRNPEVLRLVRADRVRFGGADRPVAEALDGHRLRITRLSARLEFVGPGPRIPTGPWQRLGRDLGLDSLAALWRGLRSRFGGVPANDAGTTSPGLLDSPLYVAPSYEPPLDAVHDESFDADDEPLREPA